MGAAGRAWDGHAFWHAPLPSMPAHLHLFATRLAQVRLTRWMILVACGSGRTVRGSRRSRRGQGALWVSGCLGALRLGATGAVPRPLQFPLPLSQS